MGFQPQSIGLITRCKDEFFIKEFYYHYLNQGVDHIYIIDDNSNDKSIYSDILDKKVSVIYSKDIIESDQVNQLYKKIKDNFKWMIYVDVDEFIFTKKRKNKTIKQELETTFSSCDCIKVPWMMMSSGGKIFNPESVVIENNTRWDHDKEHIHNIKKFRCRRSEIEVKCIFRTSKFHKIKDHHPINQKNNKLKVVNSIDLKEERLNPFYQNLTEAKIKNSYLICAHFRIISKENSLNKIRNNYWYKKNNYSINDLNKSDFSEVIDNDLRMKSILSTKKKGSFYSYR